MKTSQKNLLFIGVSILILSSGYAYFYSQQKKHESIISFSDCVAAGYPKTESYPEECRVPGKKFVNPNQEASIAVATSTPSNDFKNLSYIIDGQNINFKEGRGILGPNKLLTRGTTTLEYIDVSLVEDINNDFVPDTTFIVVSMSNNPSSYYIVTSISLYKGYTGANALYVGSNLASTTLSYKDNKIVLEYSKNFSGKERFSQSFIFEDDILKPHQATP